MRKLEIKHVLAVLRTELGIGQKEMAELADCSRPTIQAVELGKLKMSESLASRISAATGVELAWLLNNDLDAPPTALGGARYTTEHFEAYQGMRHVPLSTDSIERTPDFLIGAYTALRGIFASASTKSEQDWQLAWHKLDRAIRELRLEFGTIARIGNVETLPDFYPDMLRLIEHDVYAVRQRCEPTANNLFPPPTAKSMIAYRKFRKTHEFARKDTRVVRSRAKPPMQFDPPEPLGIDPPDPWDETESPFEIMYEYRREYSPAGEEKRVRKSKSSKTAQSRKRKN